MFSGVPNGPLRLSPPQVHAAVHNSGTTKAIPLGRLAEPAEIAGPIAFLASNDASYMIGSELVVDGGYITA